MPMHRNDLFVLCRKRSLSCAGGSIALALILILSGCGKKATVQTPRKTTAAKPARTASAPSGKTARATTSAGRQPTTAPAGGAAATAASPLALTGPAIRIGLTTTAREVRISSPAEFYVLERIPEATRRSVSGEVQMRIERGEAAVQYYRVQVASLSSRDSAEALRARLEEAFEAPVLVRDNPASSTFQVRVGEFETREEAVAFATAELGPAGYPDYMVVRDSETSGNGERHIALRGNDLFLVNSSGFLVSPVSTASPLRLDGKPYRGIFEVTVNRSGHLTVVNQLGVEEYLLGVVPAEISPTRYPEYAALAAQAVAARTYALRNTGRYRSDGFDLTADVRTQVYGGASLETAATNEAVRSTAGLAIYYRGELIDAMYTSTCGGRTEDFARVFDGPDVPYLKSVPCSVEGEAAGKDGLTILGKHRVPPEVYSADGRLASRNLELAQVLGISDPERMSSAEATAPPSADEAARWISRAASFARSGKGADTLRRQDIVSRSGFITHAAKSIFGEAEIERRMSSGDAGYYLGSLNDESEIPPGSKNTFAFLVQAGLWSPFPDNSVRPRETITRTDALSLLVRCLEFTRPEILRGGSFAGADGSSAADPGPVAIPVRWGTRKQQFSLGRELRLFRMSDAGSAPVDQVRLIGGEKLRFHLDADGKMDFLEIELNPTGAASDRFSPVASWKATITAAELAEKLRPLAGNIGQVLDVRPSLTGESGRAVRMELIGSHGTTSVNGYKFRGALGLRDTLFTITRSVSPDGRVESFTFQGRGWGHGVGLCQVGAYGMARAGRTFEEILKTYYQSVELRKAY